MFNEQTWKDGEKIVQEYMKKQGYKIIYTNFSCVGVELDIVAILSKKVQIKRLKEEYKQKQKTAKNANEKRNLKLKLKNDGKNLENMLIVCEVKSRSLGRFGKGYEAVGTAKQKHLVRGAKYLLMQNKFKNMQIRFDVASVDDGKITYFENAFLA